MKALPKKVNPEGLGFVTCPIEEATHVKINIPGPSKNLTLPIILKGSRANTNSWSWNGSVIEPTLKPSILTEYPNLFRCHSFVNDGKVQFLSDCSHELVNQTLDLLDVEE